ncbi:hypothetical protein MCERE19_04028 [Spirosomataceae bacterium]|jgi:hypothetical protein
MSYFYGLNKVYSSVESLSKKLVAIKHWKLLYTFVVTLFCLFTAKPSFDELNGHYVETISHQIKHPFKPIPEKFIVQNEKEFNGSKSHLDKVGFRFMAPLVANILKLNYYELVYLLFFGFFFFYYFLIRFFENNQFETTSIVLAPLLFATTFIGKWGLYDAWYFDGFAYLLILVSICGYNPLITFITGLSSCFVDERSIFALLISIFFFARVRNNIYNHNNKKQYLSLLTVLLTYVIIRLSLQSFYSINSGTSAIGGVAMNFNFQFIPITTFSTFEFSIIPILMASLLFWHLNKLDLILFILLIVSIVGISNLVFDVSRSLAYGFPLILTSLILISRNQTKNLTNKLLIIIIALNLLIPTYSFCANFTLLKPVSFDAVNSFVRYSIEKIFL